VRDFSALNAIDSGAARAGAAFSFFTNPSSSIRPHDARARTGAKSLGRASDVALYMKRHVGGLARTAEIPQLAALCQLLTHAPH
jgi:hypothetical protein